MSKPTIADLPPKYQAQAWAQLGEVPHPKTVKLERVAEPKGTKPAKHRLRQSQKPLLNKLETRFLAKLEEDYAGQIILKQAVRLELARGQWYKPDFVLPHGRTLLPSGEKRVIAYEVKGPKVFRGGFENLKTAARVHPWIQFWLVWEEDGTWARQEVLP